MSESNNVVSRYYSACELTPHLSINNEIDNDITTTPSSTNTNSLDWKDFNYNNEENVVLEQQNQNSSNIIDNGSNINDARWTLPGSSLPPIVSNSHPLQERTSIPAKLTNSMITSAIENSNEKGDEKGGIVVTTVKVVEVYNSVGDDSSQLNTQQSDQNNVVESRKPIQDIDNSQSDERHVVNNNNNNNNTKEKNLQQRKNSQRVKQNSGKKEKRSRNNIIQNESHLKKAPSVKRVIQLRRSSQVLKKSLRVRRQMEYAPTSNSISSNDPTDMEADLPPLKSQGFPWMPVPNGPPKLIHASLIPLPHKNLTSNLKHTKKPSIQLDKTSKLQLFNPRNPFANLMSSNSTKVTKVNKEQQESPIEEVKPGNRASQIFRRKLLEQSLAMSFNVSMTPNNASQSQQRPLIRKKTRKGSNARLEDREARRERRRKEREEKKAETEISNKDSKNLDSKGKMKEGKEEKKEANKSIVMSKILDSNELEKIVVGELKRRETLISPQPPLRRKTNESIIPPDLNLIQKRESIILTQPPLRRKTNENIPTFKSGGVSVEQPPFPTHLAPQRKTSIVEENKLHVVPPPIFTTNSATTTPSEELDITADFSKQMIINDVETKNEEEKVSENRASPIITTSSAATTPVSSIPVPTASIYNRFVGLFNKREQSNQSVHLSSTSNFHSSSKSQKSSPVPPKSPSSPTATSFSFLPRSPKSPIKSTTSLSSFLPRYSRSSSPNPSTSSLSSSSRTSQISNPTNSRTSKSSRATSPNPNISRSSTPNQTLSPTSRHPSSSRFTTSNPLKSRPITPTLQFSPRPPLSPKTSSLPTSPVFPKSSSRPLSPLKSPKATKLLRPGYTRHQTDSAVTDPERLRKMQKFEAIIAKAEANNNNNAPKNTRTSKIRALKSAIIPVPPVTIATASSSNATLTNSINNDNNININNKDGVTQIEKTIRNSINSDTIHFNLGEKENIGHEDGVIRLTITPAVCR